jgi:PAS domain S-box-containing protein
MERPAQSIFTNHERELMAEVARRLCPAIAALAKRWAAAIRLDAPPEKLANMRQTLAALNQQVLGGFFERLSAKDPEGALSLYDRFIEGLISKQLGEPEQQRATIESLFASARVVRTMLSQEIERTLKGDERRVAPVLLSFSKLWARAAESLGLIYTRLQETHLRGLYDSAQRTAEQLRESEERFRLLVEEAKDYAIWMLDPSGCVASWNRGAEQMTGWTAAEIIGRHFSCFYLPEERAAGVPRQAMETARNEGRSENEGWRLRKDASRFIVNVVMTAMRDRTGRMIGFSSIWRDITEPKRREHELMEARDAALESSRLKSAFLANMSHEIHTPLNIMLGYADLMAERLAELGYDCESYAEPIRRAGKRLLDTIGAILEVSRLEAGNYKLEQHQFDLTDFVNRLFQEFRILAANKGLDLRLDTDTLHAIVRFDERCLSNAVTNLLQNAIKFTERGSVSLRLYRDEAHVPCLQVCDTGVGIDPAFLPHVFDAFSQENPSLTRKFEGVGLGLALVRKYLELNGAEIDVSSQKGKGTTFTIRFLAAAELPCDSLSN